MKTLKVTRLGKSRRVEDQTDARDRAEEKEKVLASEKDPAVPFSRGARPLLGSAGFS